MVKEYRACLAEVSHMKQCWVDHYSVNLAYVSTARAFDVESTRIAIVGEPQPVVISEEYFSFLRDWHSVKR